MIICGLKLTHDGGIALLEDEKLPCNIEREKLDNSLRYQPLDRLEVVEEVLLRYNCRLTDIDVFVVNGWFAAPGDRTPLLLRILNGGVPATSRRTWGPYCRSPFTVREEPSLVGVWDGGVVARLSRWT